MLSPTESDPFALLNGPHDTVTIRPSGGGWVTLVGYDEAGEVQIEVRIRQARASSRWEAWLLRWLRGWTRKPQMTLLR